MKLKMRPVHQYLHQSLPTVSLSSIDGEDKKAPLMVSSPLLRLQHALRLSNTAVSVNVKHISMRKTNTSSLRGKVLSLPLPRPPHARRLSNTAVNVNMIHVRPSLAISRPRKKWNLLRPQRARMLSDATTNVNVMHVRSGLSISRWRDEIHMLLPPQLQHARKPNNTSKVSIKHTKWSSNLANMSVNTSMASIEHMKLSSNTTNTSSRNRCSLDGKSLNGHNVIVSVRLHKPRVWRIMVMMGIKVLQTISSQVCREANADGCTLPQCAIFSGHASHMWSCRPDTTLGVWTLSAPTATRCIGMPKGSLPNRL
ncbi:hypothetical protein BKA93DRAFT_199071 [Sparassis latifolia]